MTVATVPTADASTFGVETFKSSGEICLTTSRPKWSMDSYLTAAEARQLAATLIAAADALELIEGDAA